MATDERSSKPARKRPGQPPVITAPGPSSFDMLKALPRIRNDQLGFMTETRERYGDVVQFPVPNTTAYMISHPDDVDHVMRVHARTYGKDTIQYRSLQLVTGEGLLAADTGPWRRQRRLVQPAFHHEAVAGVADHVQNATHRLLGEWDQLPDGTVVDFDAAMKHTALDVVGHALFGTDLSGDAERIADATMDGLDVIVARARNPIVFPQWIPTRRNRQLERCLTTLDTSVAAMVADRQENGPRTPPDMLDLLLGATDGDDRFTVQQVRDQVVTFLVAGHETVANNLVWTWWHLANNPDAFATLQAEIDAVLDGRFPTLADYPNLTYTRAVIDESLRLNPPGWVVSRKNEEPDQLRGHEIPANSLLIISPWVIHRHPDFWTEPDTFDPTRFLPENAERLARGSYLPFGTGPRQCIGRDFALYEAVLMLAGIAQRYNVSPGPREPRLQPLVTLGPADGLLLHVARR
jgi:cytochrome P450